MIKDQPSQRGLWNNRFHILSKKGEKRFSFLVPLTQVPKPKHTNYSSYEPGHPSWGTSWVNNGERQGRATLPTLSIILKMSHCPRSETCFVLNPMIHTLGPNPQRCNFQLATVLRGQTFNLRASIEPRQLWSFSQKELGILNCSPLALPYLVYT